MCKKWFVILGVAFLLRKVAVFLVGKDALAGMFGGLLPAVLVLNGVAIYVVWRCYTLWEKHYKQ